MYSQLKYVSKMCGINIAFHTIVDKIFQRLTQLNEIRNLNSYLCNT
jgi:hypothetical protein